MENETHGKRFADIRHRDAKLNAPGAVQREDGFLRPPSILCVEVRSVGVGQHGRPVSYTHLDVYKRQRYIRSGECASAETRARIDRLHRINQFKLQLMPVFPLPPELESRYE